MIIGICGKKYNGKDTVADYLVAHHNFTKLSFAEPIKKIVQIIFNFSEEQINGGLKETIDTDWNITPRQTFQYIGDDLIKRQIHHILPEIGENIWVRLLENKLEKLVEKSGGGKYVISDVRFQNEADMIRKYGGVIIKIIKPDTHHHHHHHDTHESECVNISPIDFTVMNDDDLHTLHGKINKLVEEYAGGGREFIRCIQCDLIK